MENQHNNQTTNQNPQNRSSGLSSDVIELAKIVYHFGNLRPYPLSEIQIQDWAYWIDRLFPKLDRNVLLKVLEKMMLSEYKFENQQGIQSIILGIKKELIAQRNNGKTLIV